MKFGTWYTIQSQHCTTCSGECCSVYGMLFVDCVANLFPIDNMKMEDIMYECHYSMCMSPESMLYWLSIDTILVVFGKCVYYVRE